MGNVPPTAADEGGLPPEDPEDGEETPGDIEAPDIVSRTGEEMPDATHDERSDT